MNSNNLIVREYLASLKEDTELDYLFPQLLSVMGFQVVQTAKESKGQSQYGKDIIAIGKDQKGIKYKWYFELKGYQDRDITQGNYFKADGIRESILEAKDTPFEDSTIVGFNDLPIKIVIVHNGVLKTNIRNTFEGFISKEFKEGEFERWDIYYLTDLFSEYLFNEYLLSDEPSNRLLKKTLAFLDTPGNEFIDFKRLVQLQFSKVPDIKSRSFKKLFATLGLLNSIITHYSNANGYLVSAKECSKYLIIKTWNWIITNNLSNKKPIITEFKKLLTLQLNTFNKYFKKTFNVARIKDGLFAENGGLFEKIGYPIRCFEYLDDMVYYSRLRNTLYESNSFNKVIDKQKDLIIEVINNNSGFHRPILDNQSIPIVQLLIFILEGSSRRKKDVDFAYTYVLNIVNYLKLSKLKHKMLPDLYNRTKLLIEFVSTGIRPAEYCDSSSILLAILLELSVAFDSEELFMHILSFIEKDLSLQIVSLNPSDCDVESSLFDRHLHNEYFVDCIERSQNDLKYLKEEANFSEFKNSVVEKKQVKLTFKCDELGLSCIRYLAHSYYKNEILPSEWRELIED